MVRIRTKLLPAFFISILLLAVSSFYGLFFIDKLSKIINENTVTKNASDEAGLRFGKIENILTLYAISDSDKLPALKSEYDFSKGRLDSAAKKIKQRQDLKEFSAVIDKMRLKIAEIADKMIVARREQLKKEGDIGSSLAEMKKLRYEIIDKTARGSEKLKLGLAQMGYEDNEFNFQYKDKKHLDNWFAGIENARSNLEKEKFDLVLPLLDEYFVLAQKVSGARFEADDLGAKNQYYLIQADNILVEYNIAASHITAVLDKEKNIILDDSARQKKISLFFIFTSFLAVILVSIIVSRSINAPIEELVKVARKISFGDLSQRADVNSNDEMGYLAGVFNLMIDSIEKSGKKIEEEGDELRAIISSMGEGLLVLDRKLNIILMNKTAEKALGVSLDDVAGQHVKKILTVFKGDTELPLSQYPANRMFKSGEAVSISIKDNYYYKTLSGKMLPVEIVTAPLFKDGIKGAIVVFKDITDLKVADEDREYAKINLENALKTVYIERDLVREQKTKLEAILNSIGDAVFAVDKEKKVILFNSAAEKITGFSFKDIKNHLYSDYIKFIDEITKAEKNEFINAALSGEKTILSNHTVLVAKDKNLVSVDQTTAPIRNSLGEIIGCIIVFRDVTAKREVDRMRSDFISIASHQLRTPLSGMKWFLEILLNGDVGKLNPKQAGIIKETYANNQNMIDLVNKMLDMSRIESNRMVVNFERVNLADMVKKIIGEIKPMLRQKGQKIHFTGLKDTDLEVNADKILIKNILGNLISNASRYTPVGGEIKVKITQKEKNSLLFSVKDNGIGIPKKEQYRIFKKFFRATNAVEFEANGTGLGLYIVKSILDIMGGKIWFKSEQNKGTEFLFTLPIDIMWCSISK